MHVTTVPQSLMFLRGQTEYMRDHGFELVVVSSPGPELDAFAAREGVRAHAVPMERRVTPLKDLASLARLTRVLLRERPDIVHAHTPKGGLLGILAATLVGVPTRIYHLRGLALMGARGARLRLLTATERVSCGLATEVIAVSPSLRAVALELDLVAADKLRVLAGGSGQGVDATGRFDPARFDAAARAGLRSALGLPDGALVFGFVGRIVRDKGLHELARAWAEVRLAHPEAHLVIVGPFEDQDPIDPAVRAALEADERVHFTGPTTDTPSAYAAMDVVVLPTYREGFPNVPLEAASMGLPVIATRIPGCVDAVADGETGLLVAAREHEELSSAMRRYAADPELRAEHGRRGRARVCALFRREAIWAAILERYRLATRDVSNDVPAQGTVTA